MIVIGIVGGIGSGKSFVAEQFKRLGAAVLDADRAGHEVLRRSDVCQAIQDRWGGDVVGPDGHVDRGKLARIVFGPTAAARRELECLEQLTHPLIGTLLGQQAKRLEEAGVAVAVLDAPVMLRAGWDECCDRIIFVEAPRDVRLARCRARGWSEQEFRRREAAQESLDRKRERADAMIDNSGSRELARRQVEDFWYTEVS